ncbi:2-C-methyl-D-erythritol 4-phosphate cytidylyltransferase [Faecalicatena orotica]|uniref:2-C-methyl-D-erythritol 4-phosphate cytidylyltransferase n=1 Tax=Faecalicatena orotica TaxID=1544 RepID=A0A2Y9BMW7_9FIRM|nr:2-C-methyl-D-erythritol 4-phosphate cytidylyltransferase [Faecalicatena orotica]PWJ18383.1 2-C-methyl-D-erythritol 4-phosphate cytidylyltransferase [Faecalicatena orotica]SSA58752.1 2-C-methyl-D-erythritol 4-phosphate cytidylyltransferase [Faecalicatena orotica]
MEKAHCTAIVLAAGQGKRMGTKVHKQYLELAGKPVLYYSLKAFAYSDVIDEIYLITGPGEEEHCRREIIEKYEIPKVTKILPGGAQRYHSVWNGVQEMEEEGYVFIHDGARPFVNHEIIERVFQEVIHHKACVVGMPVKDTIKVVDDNEFVKNTPDRKSLWMIQTPQVFENHLIKGAYSMLMRESYINVTDDAMVVEQMLKYPIKLVCGSYENIKITTPEDLDIAEVMIARSQK